MTGDAYIMHDLDYERVIHSWQRRLAERPWAAEDYEPRREEVESLFLYALGVECTGAPGFHAFSTSTRMTVASRTAAAFIAAAGAMVG